MKMEVQAECKWLQAGAGGVQAGCRQGASGVQVGCRQGAGQGAGGCRQVQLVYRWGADGCRQEQTGCR